MNNNIQPGFDRQPASTQATAMLAPRLPRLPGLVVVALLHLAGCSHLTISKDPNTEYARNGAYVAGGISSVDENFDAFEDLAHDADEHKVGINLRAGYRFHPRFAAEVALQTYDEFDVEINGIPVGGVSGWAVTGNIKGYLSTSHFQPYGFFGLGYGDTDNSTGVSGDGSEAVVAGGFGADYYFKKNFAMYFEAAYYHPTGDTDEFDFVPLTVGAKYRF